jgi:Na+/H+-translocating membrane pyrophosphatase
VLFTLYLFRDIPKHMVVGNYTLAVLTVISFVSGAAASGLAGYIGVWISVRVNIRVASAAARYSYQDALMLSFRGGAVSAVLSASSCILGLAVLYVLTNLFIYTFQSGNMSHQIAIQQIPQLLTGYGFGASFVALFMQLGGGIYTKAADVGADMVGKIEKDIPEDDQRNPAVIADLVGDNVGDCAGSMADVFESIAAEIIGTMILGGALAADSKLQANVGYIFFPLVIHALDLVISAVGILLVKNQTENEASHF